MVECKFISNHQNNLWGNPVYDSEICWKKMLRDMDKTSSSGCLNLPLHVKLLDIVFWEITHECEVDERDASDEDEDDDVEKPFTS